MLFHLAEPFLAEEDLVPDEEGGDSERAPCRGGLGVSDELGLHFGVLGGVQQGASVELYVEGQKARRVIHNMGYETPELHAAVQRQAEELRAEGELSAEDVTQFLELYDRELVGYTYLEAL